jgi:hypothetical protein
VCDDKQGCAILVEPWATIVEVLDCVASALELYPGGCRREEVQRRGSVYIARFLESVRSESESLRATWAPRDAVLVESLWSSSLSLAIDK